MIQVRRTKSGQRSYRVRYETPAGREVSRTFRRKEDALAYERLVKDRVRNGDLVVVTREQRQRTVASFWDEAIEFRRLEARTRSRYQELWRLHVAPAWAAVAISKVGPLDVRAWVRRLQVQGLANATVAQCVSVLSLAMNEAIEQGARAENPTRGCRPKPERQPAGRSLSSEDVASLLSHAEERDRPLLFLASVSGLRFGELAGLQVGDVHPRACRISVNRAVIELEGRQEIKPYPKGGSDSRREVGVPSSVIELLLPLLRGREEADWLFTNRSGGPLFYKATRRRLVAALDAAGLPRGGLHMLRRTAATLSLQQGTSVRDVQNLLGHASPHMTLTRYATVDVTSQTAGSERVAGAIISARTRPKSGHDLQDES